MNNTDRIFSLHQKKDYDYYAGINTNRWNKKGIQSKKMLKQYHDREDLKNQLFKQYEDQLNLKDKMQQTQQMSDTLQYKDFLQQDINQKKLNRKLLQFESNQCVDVMNQQEQLEGLICFLYQNIGETSNDYKRPLIQKRMKHEFKQINRGQNFWNDFKHISKKNVNQVITKKVLQKDEFACQNIQNKIQNDLDNEQLLKEYQKFTHDLTLQKFYDRQKQNQDLHQQLRIEKNSNKELTSPFYSDYEAFQRISQNKKVKKYILKDVSGEKIKSQSQDFNGLYLGDIDIEKNQQKHIPLIKKVQNCQILQNKIEFLESERQQRSGKNIICDLQTARSRFNSTNLSKTMQNTKKQIQPQADPFVINLNQLDEFDQKFQTDKNNKKTMGYPKIQLLDIQYFERLKI